MNDIPIRFKPFFWDTEFEKLDKNANAAYIIARLYNNGGFSGIFWVNRNFSEDEIVAAVKTRMDFSPIVANYLRKKYNLKKFEMNYYRTEAVIPWR